MKTKTKQKFDKERWTTPVINLIQTNKMYLQEYMKRMIGENGLHEKAGDDLVQAHKEVFGRQTYCWAGEFKYWVWDFGKWRVYVSNKKGISVEVDRLLTPSDVMVVLRHYWGEFGV